MGCDGWSFLRTDKEYQYEEILKRYAHIGLDYCFDEVIEDAGEEVIKEVLETYNTYRVGIVKDDESIEYYDDLIGCMYNYGLSVSTLYNILLREGLNPIGNKMSFTCTGVDGVVYEFSYDYYDAGDEYDNKAYYLADGEIKTLGRTYNSHISAREASELFGINIHTEWYRDIDK